MTTDPGAVPSNARPLPTDTKERDVETGMYAGWRCICVCVHVHIHSRIYVRVSMDVFVINVTYHNCSGEMNKPGKYRQFCKRCRAFKPPRAHHCSICNRYICIHINMHTHTYLHL